MLGVRVLVLLRVVRMMVAASAEVACRVIQKTMVRGLRVLMVVHIVMEAFRLCPVLLFQGSYCLHSKLCWWWGFCERGEGWVTGFLSGVPGAGKQDGVVLRYCGHHCERLVLPVPIYSFRSGSGLIWRV